MTKPAFNLAEPVSPCLAAALEYQAAGLALLPLVPGGKEPLMELLPRDCTGKPVWKPLALRPANEAEIRDWFTRLPDCNIGIITGKASGGLVVVDWDTTPPSDWLRPITPSVWSGRGEHLYLRTELDIGCPQLLTPEGSCIGEVRGNGGYVVAPPSRHPSGTRYTWQQGLSPTDLNWAFAELPDWALAGLKTPLSRQSEASMNTPGEASMNTGTHTRFTSGVFPGLKELYGKAEVVRAVAVKLGIPQVAIDRIGRKFLCVIAGHEEKRSSAALFRQTDGHVLYHDFHCRSGPEWYTLAEVYASRFYGRALKLNPPEQAAWQLRLLVEAEVIAPAAVPLVELPSDATKTVRKVYQGFRLLLGCKWLHTPGDPTAFSWRFAAAWCGVSERLVGEAMQYLLGRGYVLNAGKQLCGSRKLTVFLPGSEEEVALKTIKRAFPGTEEA